MYVLNANYIWLMQRHENMHPEAENETHEVQMHVPNAPQPVQQ
jgi:hypothetical protein